MVQVKPYPVYDYEKCSRGVLVVMLIDRLHFKDDFLDCPCETGFVTADSNVR